MLTVAPEYCVQFSQRAAPEYSSHALPLDKQNLCNKSSYILCLFDKVTCSDLFAMIVEHIFSAMHSHMRNQPFGTHQ